MSRNPRPTLASRLHRWARRFLAPTVTEILRIGKVYRTLWEGAQIQKKQREAFRIAGERAVHLAREGKISDMVIERIWAKIERSEKILARQDILLKSYQTRGDIREVLREDKPASKEN